MNDYQKPEIDDLGCLSELTEAVSVQGQEDGGSKLNQFHHSAPAAP